MVKKIMEKFRIINKINIKNLPQTAGVYCFYNKAVANKKLLLPIYIGKAVNIKNRVKNHFFQPTYKDNLFINSVQKIGYIKTNSEIFALILEANLIKKCQPKFNVIWKDDKDYFYVAVVKNKQKIPYVYITHQPYHSSLRGAKQRSNLISVIASSVRLASLGVLPRNDGAEYIGPFVDGAALKKTLKFLRRVFPFYTTAKHSKLKCGYCHLDLCPGPNPDLGDYKKSIKKLILVLKGKSKNVLNSLKKEMAFFSKQQNFEKAVKIRDQIFALQKIMLHGKTPFATNMRSPNYDEWQKTERVLRKIIGSKQPISRIECYDISNIQGKFAAGSMVVFIDGKPDKGQYKKFRIRMKNEPNDIAMLKEVLQRRLVHTEWKYPEIILIDGGKAQLNAAINTMQNLVRHCEEQSDEAISTSGIASSVRLASLGVLPRNDGVLSIKIISIAKGRQELFIEGRKSPIALKNLPQEIYNLIKNLDNEAHCFAIAYHKKLRRKSLLDL